MKNPKKLLEILEEYGYDDLTIEDAENVSSNKNIKQLKATASSVRDVRLSKQKLQEAREQLFANAGNPEKKSEEFYKFVATVQKIREGKDDETGAVCPRNFSFAEATQALYGMSFMEYLRVNFGVSNRDTLSQIANKTGRKDSGVAEIKKWVSDYGRSSETSLSSIQGTRGINEAYRFIIPEIIMTAIDLGYKSAAKYVNWIASSENVGTNDIKVPFIEEGDLMPHIVAEGGSIPFGTMKFGQKSVKTFKVGIGLRLTQELVEQSSINMLSLFLSLVGVRMSRGADFRAIQVLINGEQADLSESAPVIGVQDTAVGLQHYDMDFIMGQLDMLNQPATRLISRLGLVIEDLNKDFPQRERKTVKQYAIDNKLAVDMYYMPAGQYLFVDTNKAMMELVYGSMRVAQETNNSNQTEEIYVTKHIGFAIMKRDARVIVDRSVSYSTAPIPSYMDVETNLYNGFKQ